MSTFIYRSYFKGSWLFSTLMAIIVFFFFAADQMVLRRNAMRGWQIKELLRRQPTSGV